MSIDSNSIKKEGIIPQANLMSPKTEALALRIGQLQGRNYQDLSKQEKKELKRITGYYTFIPRLTSSRSLLAKKLDKLKLKINKEIDRELESEQTPEKRKEKLYQLKMDINSVSTRVFLGLEKPQPNNNSLPKTLDEYLKDIEEIESQIDNTSSSQECRNLKQKAKTLVTNINSTQGLPKNQQNAATNRLKCTLYLAEAAEMIHSFDCDYSRAKEELNTLREKALSQDVVDNEIEKKLSLSFDKLEVIRQISEKNLETKLYKRASQQIQYIETRIINARHKHEYTQLKQETHDLTVTLLSSKKLSTKEKHTLTKRLECTLYLTAGQELLSSDNCNYITAKKDLKILEKHALKRVKNSNKKEIKQNFKKLQDRRKNLHQISVSSKFSKQIKEIAETSSKEFKNRNTNELEKLINDIKKITTKVKSSKELNPESQEKLKEISERLLTQIEDMLEKLSVGSIDPESIEKTKKQDPIENKLLKITTLTQKYKNIFDTYNSSNTKDPDKLKIDLKKMLSKSLIPWRRNSAKTANDTILKLAKAFDTLEEAQQDISAQLSSKNLTEKQKQQLLTTHSSIREQQQMIIETMVAGNRAIWNAQILNEVDAPKIGKLQKDRERQFKRIKALPQARQHMQTRNEEIRQLTRLSRSPKFLGPTTQQQLSRLIKESEAIGPIWETVNLEANPETIEETQASLLKPFDLLAKFPHFEGQQSLSKLNPVSIKDYNPRTQFSFSPAEKGVIEFFQGEERHIQLLQNGLEIAQNLKKAKVITEEEYQELANSLTPCIDAGTVMIREWETAQKRNKGQAIRSFLQVMTPSTIASYGHSHTQGAMNIQRMNQIQANAKQRLNTMKSGEKKSQASLELSALQRPILATYSRITEIGPNLKEITRLDPNHPDTAQALQQLHMRTELLESLNSVINTVQLE